MSDRELVERLAREAGDEWDSTLPDDRAFLDRFAALVAGECAKLCLANIDPEWPGDEVSDQCRRDAGAIYARFGIEEV